MNKTKKQKQIVFYVMSNSLIVLGTCLVIFTDFKFTKLVIVMKIILWCLNIFNLLGFIVLMALNLTGSSGDVILSKTIENCGGDHPIPTQIDALVSALVFLMAEWADWNYTACICLICIATNAITRLLIKKLHTKNSIKHK